MTQADDPDREDASERRSTLLDSLSTRFGRFFTLFGSAAAVTAFLVYSGFMSDFGAYRLAALPRLSLSLTSLAEQGAEVVIDTLSLLAGGLRWLVLLIGLGFVVLIWSHHDRERVGKWIRSPELFQLSRILLLILAVTLFAGLVDRTQRSLSGSDRRPDAVEAALREAYSEGFPDPYRRMLAIERQTYELRGFFPPNLAPRLDIALEKLLAKLPAGFGVRASSYAEMPPTTGIPLRRLPEARAAARHTYGWTSLTLLAVIGGIVLIGWWGRWLALGVSPCRETSKANDPPLAAGVSTESKGAQVARSRLLGGIERGIRLLGTSFSEPMERLLSPLTLLATVLSAALLPLIHGLLARETLGAETVMVYLASEKPSARQSFETKGTVQEETTTQRQDKVDSATRQDRNSNGRDSAERIEQPMLYPEPTAGVWPRGRFDCDAKRLNEIEAPLERVRLATRDVAQSRRTHGEQKALLHDYREAIQSLGLAVIRADCADAIRQLWSAQPSDGLRILHPEVAESFETVFQRAEIAYGVQVGTILAYPRDDQGLLLTKSIVPRQLALGGQSSLVSLAPASFSISIVMPDRTARHLNEIQTRIETQLIVDPSSGVIQDLFATPGGDALKSTLNFVRRQWFDPRHAGVAITALGTMAKVSTAEHPKAAAEAIELLADIASITNFDLLPGNMSNLRGAASTALHLAGGPYAAYRFAEALAHDPVAAKGTAECNREGQGREPLGCLPTTTTAAGYLLQDVVAEEREFTKGSIPKALSLTKQNLMDYLLGRVADEARDDVRGAACTALGLAGHLKAGENFVSRYWTIVSNPENFTKFPISSPVCLQIARLVGVPDKVLRPRLREVATGKVLLGVTATERPRLRMTALAALMELGLHNEDELLFALLTDTSRTDGSGQVQEVVEGSLLEEVDPDRMAQRLLKCMQDAAMPMDRVVHCLRGFLHLAEDFDGDGYAAERIHAAAATGRVPLRDACEVLIGFRKRGSRWVARLPDDDTVMRQCKGTASTHSELPNQQRDATDAAQLSQPLEMLSEHAK